MVKHSNRAASGRATPEPAGPVAILAAGTELEMASGSRAQPSPEGNASAAAPASTGADAEGTQSEERPRRGGRRTREELRRLLLRAGTEILWEQGLATGAEHITFKRVFEHLERSAGVRVTHASVIGRIWQNQEDYQTDVLAAAAQLEVADVDAAVEAAPSRAGEWDRSTAEERWREATEICRLGGEAFCDAVASSRMWATWMGIWALAVCDSGSARKQPIVDALVRAEMKSTEYYEATYTAAMQALGLRMRVPFTVRQFALAVDAFAQGCALRAGVDRVARDRIDRPTGTGGAGQEWTLFGVGLEALVQTFIEVDPDRAAA